ncbi:unnamed protein product [Blepharisma stoltei]|uniref:Receptor ligand binding region domain-containing protein n=1 Tax=Blepharisma stoltei TaxID=1481888 RepID=A0AAU9ICF7_9CILI|nr:unnamed protein product [Blepharisma stoltei]
MSFLAVFIYAIFYCEGQMIVDIIYSPFTSQDFALNLTSLLQLNFQGIIDFNLVYIESSREVQQLINSPDVIIDLSFSTILSEIIKELAEEKHFIIASINKPHGIYSNWEFFVHCSWENQLEALSSIISYLNWETFIIISDEIHNEGNKICNIFSYKNFHLSIFSNSNNKNSADLFIGKVVKASGIKNIVILNNGESAKLLLKSLEDRDLLINGTGIIVGSEGSYGLYGNGIIGISESEQEFADSYYSYEGLAIIKFLKLVLSFPSESDSLNLLEFLNKNTVGHRPLSNFTVINTKNSQKFISGNIFNGNLTFSSSLIFPGNSSIIPNSPITDVNIWIANGTTNPGSTPAVIPSTSAAGEFYALNYWQSLHALDGFEITSTNTDCGVSVYDEEYGVSCFSQLLVTPGVGFLTSNYPSISISYIYTLRSLNVSIPNISPYAPSVLSGNQALFPEFMTVASDIRFNIQLILNLAVIFGWKNFIVIYNKRNIENYNYFVSKIEQFDMKIVNSPDLQMIDSNYTVKDFPKWENWFSSIISLKVRLYVIFLTPPYWFDVIESFYDAGLRRGDAIFLSNIRMAYMLIWESIEDQRKINELFYGGVIVAQAEWIGEYAKTIKSGMKKIYGNDTNYGCFAFDAAMLLLYGIEFTIKHGQDLKNSEILNENLRKQKFTGCSGTVSIEQGSNQRSLPTIGVFSLSWDEDSGLLYEKIVGEYDIYSVQLITLYESIIWYDNSTVAPNDLILYENGCPFPQKQISRSEKGSNALYGIMGFVIAMTIVESLIIWKKFWKNVMISKLTAPSYVHFEDYISMGILVIDFFQFLSQGPDISKLYPWLSIVCTYSLIHFDSNVTGDIYWGYLYAAIAISCYWVATAILLVCRLNKFTRELFSHAINLALLLLPIIGNFIFIIMVSVLLSIFQCDKGIGPKITDSFIENDCTVNCWDKKFFLWGILAIFSLLTYIPLAIFSRYIYENINSHINIKTQPIFIIEKTVFQVIIVCMNKTIKVYDESLHGFCCLFIFIIFIYICLKQRPYNYHRMNLWLIISYIAILWSFIISLAYRMLNVDSGILWMMLNLVWLILIVVGITIQCKWCAGLLISDKKIDIKFFFKFEMSRNVTADDINRMKKEIADKSYSLKEKSTFV